MKVVDTKRCRECPVYRKKGFFRPERCAFPGIAVLDCCPRQWFGRPKVLKYDDAMAAEIVWMEWRATGAIVMMMPADVGGVLCGITPGETYAMADIAPRRCDGIEFRFWDGRPGEELRRETRWKGET